MAASQIDVPDLETYEWASKGEEPSSPVESVYEPLKEPKAQHDNDYQTKIYNDLRNHRQVLVELRDRLGNLEGDVTTLREDHNSLEDAFRKHNHDSRYPRQYDVYYREEADKTFAPRKHNHDDRYWRKHLAEDRYLNSTPEGDRGEGRISLPELELRVGEGFEVIGDGDYWGRNNDARVFRAKDNNADGGFLWEFTDPNGENRQEMLAIRAPDKHDSITHGGATVWHADNDGHTSGLNADKLDGTHLQTLYRDLYNVAGDRLEGNMNAARNGLHNVGRITSGYTGQYINFYNSGMSIGAPSGGGDVHVLDQTYFDGGSVYFGQTNGDRNDSYDLVFVNEPSGDDFRVHLKDDPENSSLTGTHGMLFSTDDSSPHLTVDINTQATHVNEIRSVRDERSGTPVAEGYLGNASNVGEVWYDPGPGEFRGKRAGGEVVRLGTPVNS